MKLSEAINTAKYSELNTLNIANNEEAIISLINLAMVELYNLFALETEEKVIVTTPGEIIYQLPEDFMYMVGANALFDDKIVELPINEEKNPESVNTVGYNKIQIPFDARSKAVGILYVKKPPVFTVDSLEEQIPIPPQLYQAMFCYVAYKAHGAIRLDGQSEGDIYFMRFKRICDEIKQRGTAIASDDLSMDDRIYRRGFP